MPGYPTVYKIFVSYPDDVQDEADAINQVVEKYNKINSSSSIRLEFKSWKTSVSPGVGKSAQDVINKSIGDDYDIYIGIMWKKCGEGTIEEFEYAHERYSMLNDNIQILFYFKETPITPNENEFEQINKIKEFKKRIEPICLYGQTFKEVSEFVEMLELHLPETIRILEQREIESREHQKHESTENQDLSPYKLLYEHDEKGKRINGDIEGLIGAVTMGFAIRIIVHHPNGSIQVMDAPLLSVENGIVHASDIFQVSKMRNQNGNYVYQDKTYHYFLIASSNGHFHAKRIYFDGSHRNTTTTKRHISWIGLISPIIKGLR